MRMRLWLRVTTHALGLLCLALSATILLSERWPAPVSLRRATVLGLDPSEKEMGALLVRDGAGRRLGVSAAWGRVKDLKPGTTVWIRDVDDRFGDCTGQTTVLEGPIFLTELACAGGLLYLGWLVLLLRRRWSHSEASSVR